MAAASGSLMPGELIAACETMRFGSRMRIERAAASPTTARRIFSERLICLMRKLSGLDFSRTSSEPSTRSMSTALSLSSSSSASRNIVSVGSASSVGSAISWPWMALTCASKEGIPSRRTSWRAQSSTSRSMVDIRAFLFL